MKLVEQWRALEADLPPDWSEARLELAPETPADLGRAAALLGPANPLRSRDRLRLTVVRGGRGTRPGGLARLFGRVDAERLWSTLRLLDVRREEAPLEAVVPALADAWDAAVAALPPDWSDALAELTLRSTDDVPRAALLCAPLNTARAGGDTTLRFRVARSAGYGASPGMTRRCLERCDAERIRGRVEILRALSDTANVQTQGPVWRIGRRAV